MHCLKNKGDCPDHTFSMRSERQSTFYKQNVQLTFCPQFSRDGSVVGQTFPVFNHDGKWYTPAFSLGIDKNQTPESDQHMLWEHQRKTKDALEIKRNIFLPRPSHKNKYCSVCKSNYDDYLEHIRSLTHKKTINKSRYNKHVLDLCSTLFKTQESKSDREETTKERDLEEVPVINKKRKPEVKDQQTTLRPTRQFTPFNDSAQSTLDLYRLQQAALMSMNGMNFYGNAGMGGFYPFGMPCQFQNMLYTMPQHQGYPMFFPQSMFQPLLINQTVAQ